MYKRSLFPESLSTKDVGKWICILLPCQLQFLCINIDLPLNRIHKKSKTQNYTKCRVSCK